jgi:hypothetical protein
VICLKVKGTFRQITEVLEKHYAVKVEVLTFPTEPKAYYLTINETNDVTAKLILDLSFANITMMGAVRERDMEQITLSSFIQNIRNL